MSKAELKTLKPIRDLEKDASFISFISSVAIFFGLAAYLLAQPDLFSAPVPMEDPQVIAIELLEMPEPAPVPEVLPDPEPAPEPEPKPEPEPEPEPAPLPLPKPKPKRELKKEKPKEQKPQQQTQAATTKASAPKQSQASFISAFTREVQKCKYYPKSARQAGITGIVKVRVSFDSRGYITGASLVPGNYPPVLGEAAMATINKVKNRWAPKSGGPSSLIVPINYNLK